MQIYGIEIECEQDDIEWIKGMLNKIPNRHLINGVINKYTEVYKSGDNGTLAQKGAARRNANSRLRVYVQKVTESQL